MSEYMSETTLNELWIVITNEEAAKDISYNDV